MLKVQHLLTVPCLLMNHRPSKIPHAHKHTVCRSAMSQSLWSISSRFPGERILLSCKMVVMHSFKGKEPNSVGNQSHLLLSELYPYCKFCCRVKVHITSSSISLPWHAVFVLVNVKVEGVFLLRSLRLLAVSLLMPGINQLKSCTYITVCEVLVATQFQLKLCAVILLLCRWIQTGNESSSAGVLIGDQMSLTPFTMT